MAATGTFFLVGEAKSAVDRQSRFIAVACTVIDYERNNKAMKVRHQLAYLDKQP